MDDNSTWGITITKDSRTDEFNVSYPSLRCVGNLELINSSNKTFEFKESIRGGQCVDGVRLVITKTGNKKAIYRAYWPDANHLNAEGTLKQLYSK